MDILKNIKLWPEFPKTFSIAITAIMTALVGITTFAIQLYIPATGGYFNIGEVIIYVTSILFGPIIGGIAGGVGAAFADLFGYPMYAPGTLVIKFIEGFVIGLLSFNIDFKKYKQYWRFIGVGVGILIGALICIIGITYYSATWEIGIVYLGSINVEISSIIWIILGIVSGTLMIIASLKLSPESSFYSIITIAGGTCMVIGYFLYEFFILYAILNIELLAAIEIPLNIGQVIIGLILAIPIAKVIKKTIPTFNKPEKSLKI
ncbi:MAG: ECF transporter S component [Candidatus Helarchaeota archaeon]